MHPCFIVFCKFVLRMACECQAVVQLFILFTFGKNVGKPVHTVRSGHMLLMCFV
jgi:hypothetical protein